MEYSIIVGEAFSHSMMCLKIRNIHHIVIGFTSSASRWMHIPGVARPITLGGGG